MRRIEPPCHARTAAWRSCREIADQLIPPLVLSQEQALDFLAKDPLEVTPKGGRLRKRSLSTDEPGARNDAPAAGGASGDGWGPGGTERAGRGGHRRRVPPAGDRSSATGVRDGDPLWK